MYEGYPPGYDPSMDPTLGGGGYQIGYDPMAGSQMAPPPGAGALGIAGLHAPQQAASNLSNADQFQLGAAKTVEFGSNAFFLSAMASPILASSGIRGVAAYGRFAGAVDPFRMMGAGHKVAKFGWGAGRAVGGGIGRAGGRIGLGMAGRAIGGVARMGIAGGAAATGYGIPLAAAMMAMEAPMRFAEGMAGDAMNANMGETIMSQSAPRGMNYSSSDARAWGRGGMSNMGDQFGLDRGGMQQVTSMIAGSGGLNGAQDIRGFSTKLRAQLNQLKEVSRETGAALDEAHQIIQSLKSQGFSGQNVVSQAASLRSRGSVSGLGEGALYASGAAGGDVGRQMGLNRSMMFDRYAKGASTMAFGQERGLINNDLVNFYGGAQQASMMVESTAMQGFMGSSLMGYAMDPNAAMKGQSVIDPTRMQQVLSGQLSASDLKGVSREQIGASLQSTARNRLAPHAQSSIVNMATQGGVSDAVAASRMVGLGFAGAPEQGLLMIQEQRAQAAENNRAMDVAGLTAGQSNLDSLRGAHKGAAERWWDQSYVKSASDTLYGWGESAGRGIGRAGGAVNRAFGGGQQDTQINITTESIERARRMTGAQLDMADRYLGGLGGVGAGGSGSGNRTLGFYEDRGHLADMRESDEGYYEDRYKDVRKNSVLWRQTVGQDEANKRWSSGAQEGVDFIRSEADWGTDFFTDAGAVRRYSAGVRQGSSKWRGLSSAQKQGAAQHMMGLRNATGEWDKEKILAMGAGQGSLQRKAGGGWQRYDPNGRPSKGDKDTADAQGLTDEQLITLTLSNELSYGGGSNWATAREAQGWSEKQWGEAQQFIIEAGSMAGEDAGALGNLIGGGGFAAGDIASLRGVQSAVRGEGQRWADALSNQAGLDTDGLADAITSSAGFAADFGRMTQLAGAGDFGSEAGRKRTNEARQIALRNKGAGGDVLTEMAGMMASDTGRSRLASAMNTGWNDGLRGGDRAARATGDSRLSGLTGYQAYYEASNDQVEKISGDVRAWSASKTGKNKVDRSGRVGRPSRGPDGELVYGKGGGWTSLMLSDGSTTGEEGWKRRDHFRKLAGNKGDWEGDAHSREADRNRITEEMGAGTAFDFSTSGGEWGSLKYGVDGDRSQQYVFQSKAEFDAIAAGYEMDENITKSLGLNRWVDQGENSRRTGSLGAEFLQGMGHLGQLTKDSSMEDRRTVSREIMAGIYDLQGDAHAERAGLLEATGGRGSRSLGLMDKLLNEKTAPLERARQIADLTGMDTTAALEKVKEIDAAGAEGGAGREEQVKKAIELLGGQLDQTLVSATEKQMAASESMSSAADKLVAASINLDSAARTLSGGAPDTVSEELPAGGDVKVQTVASGPMFH